MNHLSHALFSSEGFMPHGHCYLWTPSLVWTMVITDSLIGLAYISISFCLYTLVKRISLPFSAMFVSFGIFILACGATHLMEVYTLWNPAYWWAALVKIVTAVASVVTAIWLFPVRRDIEQIAAAAKENENLRQNQARLALLVDSVTDYAIFGIDLNGIVTSWNSGARRLKGYHSDEIIGKHFSVFYPKEDIAAGAPERDLNEALRIGRAEEVGWRVRQNGSRFWANVVISPIRDASDQPIGFAKVTRDLTERKRVQELEEAVEVRDEFLSVASHELKTPITSFHLYQQLLRRMIDKNMPHAEASPREVLDKIVTGVEKLEPLSRRLVKLSNELSDVARFRTDHVTVERHPTDLQKLCQSVLDSMSADIAAAGVAVTFQHDAPPVVGEWDAGRLEQVVANLLSNALKYGEGKPIEISLRKDPDSATAVLTVKDWGMGISRDLQAKIFRRFERGVASAKISGLGLGLYICQKIVEAHGGFISVESDVGSGATFLVELPLETIKPKGV